MKNRRWIWFAVVLVVVVVVVLINHPKFRANLFVTLYHDQVEEGLRMQNSVPADDAVFLGYQYVNIWEGEHTITEFIIMTRGNSYYGVYYSPDDIPAGFQNVAVELTRDGRDAWVWHGEGDNHGATSKIMDHWYYFQASF